MNIHLIGVGGTAMGNLAAMLKKVGHTVSGSDQALYPPMSDRLKEWGIDARDFSENNLEGIDLCIIGNVISRGNVEAELVLNQRIPYMSMPAALYEFFLKGKDVIVTAGTHGKTTTAFLMDHILSEADQPPGLFVGGLRADGMNGYRVSDSKYFIIEGDEYDSAFFDKGAKFLHYRPRYLILTSVEFDHADIYDNLKMYQLSFKRLLRGVPSSGLIAACVSDKGVRAVLKDYKDSKIAPYLAGSKLSKAVLNQFGSDVKRFERVNQNVQFTGYGNKIESFSMIGNHNTANAAGALLIAEAIGLDEEQAQKALQNFPGVLRRQQIRKRIELPQPKSKISEVIFMEDFAHHPTAVAKTIDAVKQAWPDYKIHALYEPRSATSHRSIFQKEYVAAFKNADSVFISDIYNKKKIDKKYQLDVKKIVGRIAAKRKKKHQSNIHFAKDSNQLVLKLQENFRPSQKGDIILAMSNGNFGGIYPQIEQWLETI